jgi:chromosome segregation ATPase
LSVEALRRASAAEGKLTEVELEVSDLRACSTAAQAEAAALRAEAAGLRAEAAGLRERVEREQALAAEVRSDRVGAAARIEEMQAALARLTVELEEARLPWWRRALFRRG